MKLTILGSGGATTIPRPGCLCRVCHEARIKGAPYSRTGPALFVHDANALFDAPEEIAQQINRENITAIDALFFTHWHPDHTLGLRIIERMNKFWLGAFDKKAKPWKQVNVYGLSEVIDDLRNKYVSFLDYYEEQKLIKTISLANKQSVKIEHLEIVPFRVFGCYGDVSTVYSITKNARKVVYAPCDVKPFPINPVLMHADVLIVGAVPEGPLKEGIQIPEGSSMSKELHSIPEILQLIAKIRPKRTFIAHIEEEWGKSFSDYEKLQPKYKAHNLEFAYDGMKIQL